MNTSLGGRGETMSRRASHPSRRSASSRSVVTSGKQKKPSTHSPGHPTNKNAGTKQINNSGQGARKNTSLHRLRQWLFGTRLRAILTGIATLVIAPAIAAILASYAPQLWSKSPEQPTKVIYYEPWNTSDLNKIALSSDVHIDRTISGHCWVSSIVTGASF